MVVDKAMGERMDEYVTKRESCLTLLPLTRPKMTSGLYNLEPPIGWSGEHPNGRDYLRRNR